MSYSTFKKMSGWTVGIISAFVMFYLCSFIPREVYVSFGGGPGDRWGLLPVMIILGVPFLAGIFGALTISFIDWCWLIKGQKALDKIFDPATPFDEVLKQHKYFLFCLDRSDRGHEMYAHPRYDWLDLTKEHIEKQMHNLRQAAI